jgi:hypothetical protein
MFGVDAAERQREHQMCLRGSRALHVGLRPLLGIDVGGMGGRDGHDPAVQRLEPECRQITKAAIGRPRRLQPESTNCRHSHCATAF